MVKPNKKPCAICKNHKAKKPFKMHDNKGNVFDVTEICNCPFCGRFLNENFEHLTN